MSKQYNDWFLSLPFLNKTLIMDSFGKIVKTVEHCLLSHWFWSANVTVRINKNIDMQPDVSQLYPFNLMFVRNLMWQKITSICSSHNPCESTETAVVFYILCASSIWSQAMILGAICEKQCRIIWWQYCGTIAPSRVSEICHQIEDVSATIRNFDIFGFLLLWARLQLQDWFEDFLKWSVLLVNSVR